MNNQIKNKPEAESREISVRFPSLTLRDLITIISVAVSIAVAYGTVSARMTQMEKDVMELKLNKVEMSKQIRRLESNSQDTNQFVDELYRSLKQPLPRRSNSIQSEY